MLAKTLGWMAVVLLTYQWSCPVIICKLYMIKGNMNLATIRQYAFLFHASQHMTKQSHIPCDRGIGSVLGVMG